MAGPLSPHHRAAARRHSPARRKGSHAGGVVLAVQPAGRGRPADGLHLRRAAAGNRGDRITPPHQAGRRTGGGAASARPGSPRGDRRALLDEKRSASRSRSWPHTSPAARWRLGARICRDWCSGCSPRRRPSRASARRGSPAKCWRASPAGPRGASTGDRTSGWSRPTGSLRSREKMVWDWPDIADRLIEELR